MTQKSELKSNRSERQSAVARWENEGGATVTGHPPSTMKKIYTRIIAYTKDLIRNQSS